MPPLDPLFDPLFLRPFLTGLAFAILLPLLGAYLRLRDEWLAALAFAQTAAAGALLALLVGAPLLLGGLFAAAVAAALKRLFEGVERSQQGAAYAVLLVAAWAVGVLLVGNLPLAERVGHALFDGQLYFTGREHLLAAALCLPLAGLILARISPALLQAHFFPDFFRARGRSSRGIHLLFDLLVAAALALATMSIGVMSAFALIFLPPLVAWRWAASWRGALRLAVAVGVAAYLLAFAVALLLDQAFGPVLALVLVAAAVVSGLAERRHGGRQSSC